MGSIQVLREAFGSLLYPFGDRYRQAEAALTQLHSQPAFITHLLELIIDANEDIGIRRVGAIYLKNKISRSWSSRGSDSISDEDKDSFRSHLVAAITLCNPSLREYLIICLARIMDYDYQQGKWPNLVPEVEKLLQNTNDLAEINAGLLILKQITKFYRWNSSRINQQLGQLMEGLYPQVLSIAEAAISALESAAADPTKAEAQDGSAIAMYYEMIYEALKIYKLSSTRFLPEVFRREDVAKRTVTLFLQVFMLPLPAEIMTIQPVSERYSQLPVKCQKWATANIVRNHNTFLTKSYSQLSDNATAYAPYRQLFLNSFAPEIIRIYMSDLEKWSQKKVWHSDNVLYNIVAYFDAMIDFKKVFVGTIEPQFNGLVRQVLLPLMCPTEDDLDLFEDDPVEFIQKQTDIHDLLSPAHVAATFTYHVVRKRKNTLPGVMELLQELANRIESMPENVKERVGFQKLLQALEPVFTANGSTYKTYLEPLLTRFVIPDLNSAHPYLRYESCSTITRMRNVVFESRETVQALFQSVLKCFFDEMNLPVQVAASQTLQALSELPNNEDIYAALKLHISDIIRNLLVLTQKIDLESLLTVLDHFVSQFPDQITPFAVDLAAQLCQQFIAVAAELAEAQRQVNETGGGAVSESEVMMLTHEKTTAGFGIMNSLANLQNNLESHRELTTKLDEVVAPVFLAVYQNELIDFYQDCLSLHENTLFTIKKVMPHHWQYFELLLNILEKTRYDYFEEAMPVLENYILYGCDLADNPERLARFVRLLVSLYTPNQDDEYSEVSARFSNARTRAHVMSLTSKLLVSSGLFNGPLLPYIGDIIDAVIARVNEDSKASGNSISFPARYNVSTVSLILSGIYHDPQTTLAALERRGAADSFFQTWLQTFTEFTHVNDLKLCVVATLSLISLQACHPEVQLAVLPDLMKTMIFSLETLPGAASRVAELMKEDDANRWDDDLDEDDYEEDFDDEFDAALAENDASAEFGDQMPDSSVVNASGDGNFMYEQPGHSTNQSGGQEEGQEDPSNEEEYRAEIRNQLVSQMGFIADDLDEEMYSMSPLDNLNPYNALRTVLLGLKSTKPTTYDALIGTLSEGDKRVLDESLQRESLPTYSPNTTA